MNDDWDGVDWAESFSGPDNDEIESQRAQEFQEEWNDEVVGFELKEGYCQRKSETNRFDSFEAAINHSKAMAENFQIPFVVEVISSYWRVTSDKISANTSKCRCPDDHEVSCGISADELLADQSKYYLGFALFKALQNQDRKLALQLLERPIRVNSIGHGGSSPLMVAAYRGYPDVCEKLLGLGATFQTEVSMDPHPSRDDEYAEADTVMHRAFSSRDWQTIEVISKAYIAAEWTFLKNIVPVDSSDLHMYGYPRLVEAARYGMTALCAEMIECGVDVNEGYSSDTSDKPIEAAYGNKKMDTCFALVAMGADISALREFDGYTKEFESALSIVKQYLG